MSNADVNDVYNLNKPPSSKSKSSMNIFKVALSKLRNRKSSNNTKSGAALPASTNTTLTKIIGSVRPLHLQSSVGDELMYSPPPSSDDQPQEPGLVVVQEGAALATSSRCSSSRSLGGMTSMYASAQSLYDLDDHDGDCDNDNDNDEDAYYDGIVGDELIDVKAELFIANFYQQMRLEN